MVKCIPSAVILCTRDRTGSVVGSIGNRGRERELVGDIAMVFWEEIRRMKKMLMSTSLYRREREAEEAGRRCD
jgi:hypothetical protein